MRSRAPRWRWISHSRNTRCGRLSAFPANSDRPGLMPAPAPAFSQPPDRPPPWEVHQVGEKTFTINQLDGRGFSHLIATVTGATPETAHMLRAAPELLRAVEAAVGVLDAALGKEQSPVVVTALRQL